MITNYEMEKPYLGRFYRHYYTMAQSGNAYAQSYIAQANYWGWGCAKNYDAFIYWDTLAANNGVTSSGRRMFLYYLSIKDFDTAGIIYDNQNPRRHDPKGWDNPGGKMFGDWFRNMPKEEFISICKDYSSVFDFIDAMEGFVDWGVDSEFCKKRLADEEACETRFNVTKLLRAICYIFGFGTESEFIKADSYLLKDYSKEYIRVESVERDHANYLLSIYESYLPTGDSNTINSFCKGGFLHDSVFDKFKIDMGSEPEVIEFISRHALLFAFMGDLQCARHLGYMISTKCDKECYQYFYHDDKEALYWFSMVAEKDGFADVTIKAIEMTLNPQSETYNYDYGKKLCIYAAYHNNYNMVKIGDNITNHNYNPIVKAHLRDLIIEMIKGTNDSNKIAEWTKICEPVVAYFERSEREEGNANYYGNEVSLGALYSIVYKQYDTALYWLNLAESKGADVSEYKSLCQENTSNDSNGCGCVIAGIIAFIIFVVFVL